MLPKRKIIKKRHVRPVRAQTPNQTAPFTLFERLKATDTSFREEALAYVSSMCSFKQGAGEIAILTELISILYQGNNSLIHQCLYGLANLIELEPWVSTRLFQMGLDKALVQLNSGDKDLLKPIMVLMIALHENQSQQYIFLKQGIHNSLSISQLTSNCSEIVLEFLVKSQAKQLKQQIYLKLIDMMGNSQKIRIRSLCLIILLKNQKLVEQPNIIKETISYCEQIINDLDLEKQYLSNIVLTKPIKQPNTTQQMENEEPDPEEMQITAHPNYQIFADTIQGIELLFEAVVNLIEQQQWEDEDDENQQQIIQQKKGLNFNSPGIKEAMLAHFISNPAGLLKNTQLSFLQGQNIVSMALRLSAHILPLSGEPFKQQLAICCLKSIDISVTVKVPQQILLQVLVAALFVLMNCPIPKEARNGLITIGQNILQVNDHYKDCWLFLLQIYSIHFNPEKCQTHYEENKRIGSILRNLLINIPHLELEQWRAQVIDTLFDIFSNEQFDATFVQLGFKLLLQTVLNRAGAKKKKKFIRDVLLDITRFLDYKKKMISI